MDDIKNHHMSENNEKLVVFTPAELDRAIEEMQRKRDPQRALMAQLKANQSNTAKIIDGSVQEGPEKTVHSFGGADFSIGGEFLNPYLTQSSVLQAKGYPTIVDEGRANMIAEMANKEVILGQIELTQGLYLKLQELRPNSISSTEEKTLKFMELLLKDSVLAIYIKQYCNEAGFNSWGKLTNTLRRKGNFMKFLGNLATQNKDGKMQSGFTPEYLTILNSIAKFYNTQKNSPN